MKRTIQSCIFFSYFFLYKKKVATPYHLPKKRDANTRTTERYVIEEETEALGVKPLRRPPSGK